MIIIPICNFLLFWVYTNFNSILYAFQSPDETGKIHWGLQNFVAIKDEFKVTDSPLVESLKNTMIFFASNLIIVLPISFLMCYFVYKKIFMYRTFRIIFYLPSIISASILVVLFKYIISAKGPVGLITKAMGKDYIEFLTSSKYALKTILIYSIYFVISVIYLITPYQKENNKKHELYHFVNGFIYTLSVTNSFKNAFESSTLYAKNEFKDELIHIENQDVMDKLNYLSHYFNFNSYQMFLHIIFMYQEEGGDVLVMSDILRKELTRIENDQIEYESKTKSKIFEFILLWSLTFIILIFVRIALKEYFSYIVKSNFYLISISIFFIFVLVSIHFFISKLTGLKIDFRRNKK